MPAVCLQVCRNKPHQDCEADKHCATIQKNHKVFWITLPVSIISTNCAWATHALTGPEGIKKNKRSHCESKNGRPAQRGQESFFSDRRKTKNRGHYPSLRQTDLYFFHDTDEDEADYYLTLTSEETREMGAQLLGATYQPVDDDKMKIFQKQLVMEWIKLTPESPFVNKRVAESQIRNHTGASVIAVMHGDDMTVSPDANMVLKAGDTVMAAGTRDQIRRFDAMAKGESTEGNN